jgi:hypothetical protein
VAPAHLHFPVLVVVSQHIILFMPHIIQDTPAETQHEEPDVFIDET